MRREANIYICSKPLQYLNVRNIVDKGTPPNILIFESNFAQAEEVINRIREADSVWDEVWKVNNIFQLYKLLHLYSPLKIFYYLDCFLGPAILFNLLSIKELYIYEEGYGSYRTDIFLHLPCYKRVIRKFLRVPDYPGFHPATKGVYVYHRNYYLEVFVPRGFNKPVFNFKTPFLKMLSDNKLLAEKVFGPTNVAQFYSKRLALYITSWEIKEKVLERLKQEKYDAVLLKPHPHLKNIRIINQDSDIYWISTPNLVEMIIQQLLENGNTVDVYHDNSSAVLYLTGMPNLHIINIGRKNIVFDDILNGINKVF